MMTEQEINNITKKIARDIKPNRVYNKFNIDDYPFLEKHRDMVMTPTGKNVDDITLSSVLTGEVTGKDIRISKEMLKNQAQVAQSAGKPQMAQNLTRAAELTGVPDETVIKMYDMLRPNRATKAQLIALAQQLKNTYDAPLCSKLVTDALEVYEKRGILLK